MTTYSIDSERQTVLSTDEHGEVWDLNADGEPCHGATELRELVCELCEQGAYDGSVRDRLLAGID